MTATAATAHPAGAGVVGIGTQELRIELGGVCVVDGVSIRADPGQFVGLVGPNGSGKTTLLRSLHRALRPSGGSVLLGIDDVWRLKPNDVARQVAVVAQEETVSFEYTTTEVAAMGRLPHKRAFSADTDEDHRLVAESLHAMGLAALAHRPFNEMSGGERQRTMIARALVQESTILLLDEPTNHLDIHFQLDVLHRVRSLGLTTVAALHDLNLAAAWCDQVYVLSGGHVVAGGSPAQTLTPERIGEVFAVAATAFTHPVSGKHQLLFDRMDEAS